MSETGADDRDGEPVIQSMRREQLDEVMDIELHSARSPWPREVFLDEQHRDWAHLDVLSERPDGPVLAFVNYWLIADEAHVLNIATHPRARRRGHARCLLEHVLAAARARGCRTVLLEVRPSNAPALALYHAEGFRPIGRRAGYYQDGEDAIVMQLDLDE